MKTRMEDGKTTKEPRNEGLRRDKEETFNAQHSMPNAQGPRRPPHPNLLPQWGRRDRDRGKDKEGFNWGGGASAFAKATARQASDLPGWGLSGEIRRNPTIEFLKVRIYES